MLLLGLFSVSSFAQQVSTPKNLEYPGIKWDWQIKAENYTFHVFTVSNYDMKNVTFNKITKELIFTGNSTHQGNIAEIEIPRNLIGGNLTVPQNGYQLSALVIPGTDSSTVVLKFNQTGLTTTSVMGTTYLPEFSTIAPLIMASSIMIVLFATRLRKF